MNERDPLLGSTTPACPKPAGSPENAKSNRTLRKQVGPLSVCITLLLLIEFGAYLATIPLNQVLEANICQRMHPGETLAPNDPICKEKSVQTELSMIRGWQSTFEVIPSLLVAVPYGMIADEFGRGFVLALACLGITLSSGSYTLVCLFPDVLHPRLTWLSAIFTFVGGGAAVINAMVFTMTGEMGTEESRATLFFYLGAAVLLGELCAGPAVYFLMEVNTWLPIWIGLGCFGVSTILALFIPEPPRAPVDVSEAPEEATSDIDQINKHSRLSDMVRSGIHKMGQAVAWIAKRHFHIIALLFTLLLTTFGRFAQELLAQYVTKRYEWSWSQSSFLLSIRAFSNLVLLLVLLPLASYLLVSKWSFTGHAKDLWLARASGVLLTIGAFTIGLAVQPAVMIIGLGLMSLGSGYNLLVRSLLAATVEKSHIGTMYTVIGTLETVGILISGPLLAITFRVGMEGDGGWIGLPYIIAGILLLLAAVIVCSIRVSSLEPQQADMRQDQEGHSS
ncbi:hypothetical protein KVR01_007761 [Diaporthe batatas]|uniref:uncharacterized protein n=1 Tax=Diaporthe batatas TaxID=748121 RepID=UPI001D04F6E0|nr:uncharacterized protein KVR01_007761 [Diaporthe batatas]KAG8161996.1 hypothetical protein KVR01_007761 [Diaporthe batatas]